LNVQSKHFWVATAGRRAVELGDQPVSGDRAIQSAEAFAGVIVDDGDDLDRQGVAGGVELEVNRPDRDGSLRR
jgi:hypothetical protein